MKYRRLDSEELKELESEFIRFLSANSIPAEDWEKMKTSQPQRVEDYLDQFSDLVIEKVLQQVEYLEMKTSNDIKTFHCPKDKIYMMGMTTDGQAAIDFTKEQSPAEMMAEIQANNIEIKLYRAEKTYKDNREKELFAMMQAGALISKGELYRNLAGLGI